MSEQMNVSTAKTAVERVQLAYLRAIDEVAPGVIGDAIKLRAAESLLEELLDVLGIGPLDKETETTDDTKAEPIFTEGQYTLFDHLPPGSY